jgi:hypothetical protein
MREKNYFYHPEEREKSTLSPPRSEENNQWNGKREGKQHQMHEGERELPYELLRLLSIMLIDETTCVSHTLVANWYKIAELLCDVNLRAPRDFHAICSAAVEWKDFPLSWRGAFKIDLKLWGLTSPEEAWKGKTPKINYGAWRSRPEEAEEGAGGGGKATIFHSFKLKAANLMFWIF